MGYNYFSLKKYFASDLFQAQNIIFFKFVYPKMRILLDVDATSNVTYISKIIKKIK